MLRAKIQLAAALTALAAFATAEAATTPFGNLFPIPGSVYTNSNTSVIPAGPGGVWETEIISMSMRTSPDPADSIEVEPRFLDHEPFVFYDIILSIGPPGGDPDPVQVVASVPTLLRVGPDASGSGDWQTEMVSMNLSGTAPNGVPLLLREDPDQTSGGSIQLTQLPGGDFQVDSFFDVTYQISFDGGSNWNTADAPLRLDLVAAGVPEPTTACLALVALVAGGVRRRVR